MKLQSLLENISNCLTNEESNNASRVDFFEQLRENIIEKLRILNRDGISSLNKEIKKEKNIKKHIISKKCKFTLSFDYFDKEIKTKLNF